MADRPILLREAEVRAFLTGRRTQLRQPLDPQPQFFDVPILEGRGVGRVGHPGELWPFRCMGTAVERDFQCWARRAVPHLAVGDRLWGQETWQVCHETLDYETGGEYDVFEWREDEYGDPRPFLGGDARHGTKAGLFYRADGQDENPTHFYPLIGIRGDLLRPAEIAWAPAAEMPRWASRCSLLVTAVRVQRLHDITESDALAEGIRLTRDGGGVFVGREGPGRFVTPWPTAREAFFDLWDETHGHRASDANPWVAAATIALLSGNIDSPAQAAEAAHA